MTTKKKTIRNEKFNVLLKDRFKDKQADMAEALEIAPSLVWRYANGKGIGEDMKNRIHEKLNLNDDWLDGVNEQIESSSDDEEEFSKIFGLKKEEVGFDLIEMIRLYAKSGKENRIKAKEFLEGRADARSKNPGKGNKDK